MPCEPETTAHRGSVPDLERRRLADGFGAELARLRKEVGFSQGRLGELAGLRGDHIGRLERGKRRPTVAAILAVSRILMPESGREAVQQRLAGLAGNSLREGAARKKQAKDNRGRRRALASVQRSAREMQMAIRVKEAQGQLVAGDFRRLADRLAAQAARLKAETTADAPVIKGHIPYTARPASRRKADIMAWADARIRYADMADAEADDEEH
jgi:transcriptional regulator with XRE-family HTH domain